MVETKWIIISSLIVILLGSVILYLQPQEFSIVLDDGQIKAKYSEGILKVYNGRFIAFEDYLNIYYWNGKGYTTMYKARGIKYSNLSYFKNGETTFVKQTIYYSKGNLTRYFEITEYKIKESFEWKPNDENLRVYFLWTYGELDEWEEKYVYFDKNKKETKAEMDFEIVNNWENDLANIVRVERFQNGRLKIRTKVFQGNASFDPEIILKTMTETEEFKVTWIQTKNGISHKEYLVEIQNLNSTNKKDFNLSTIINGTNFGYDKINNMKIYEWKGLDKEFPVYEYNNVTNYYIYPEENKTSFIYPVNCWNDILNLTHYPCNETIKHQNGTEQKKICEWKPTKMNLIIHPDKVKSNYGNILIPKFESKAKFDDFGNIETENGTKLFKVSFNVPIVETSEGWGSVGCIGIVEENSGEFFHPWFNSSWLYKQEINISNTAGNLTNYQVSFYFNISNVGTNWNWSNSGSDIRFTNSSDISLDYWIESWNSTANTSTIWVNVTFLENNTNTTIYVYYGNNEVSSESNGTKVFELFDNFNDGNIDLDLWDVIVGTPTESNGIIEFDGADEGVTSDKSFNGNYRLMGNISLEKVASANTLFGWNKIGSGYGSFYYSIGNNDFRHYYGDTSWLYTDLAVSDGGWHNIKISMTSAQHKLWYDDILKSSPTSNLPTGNQKVKMYSGGGVAYLKVDWIAVGKYASPEPTYIIGAEESVSIYFTVTSNSPANETITNDNTTDFSFTVSGSEVSYNCTLYLNDTNKGTNTTTVNNTATTITSSVLNEGFYEWYVNCTASSVTNQSEVREITINLSYTPSNTTLYLDDLSSDRYYELGTICELKANVTDSSENLIYNASGNNICLNIDQVDYGDNFVCGNGSVSYNLTTNAVKNTFNDSSTVKNLTYTSAIENKTFYLNFNRYDDIQSAYIDLTGFENTSYPKDVKIYVNNTYIDWIPYYFGLNNHNLTEFYDGSNSIEYNFTVADRAVGGNTFASRDTFSRGTNFYLPKEANIINTSITISGESIENFSVERISPNIYNDDTSGYINTLFYQTASARKGTTDEIWSFCGKHLYYGCNRTMVWDFEDEDWNLKILNGSIYDYTVPYECGLGAGAIYWNQTGGTGSTGFFVFGGYDDCGTSVYQDEVKFRRDEPNGDWIDRTNMPDGLYAPEYEIDYTKGLIYVFGGYNSSTQYSKKTYIYNITNNSWITGTNIPDFGKTGGWAEWLNDTHIILFGGIGGFGSYTFGKRTYIYNTIGDSWTNPGSSAYLNQWGISGANINGIIYTFGGMEGSSATKEDIKYYNTTSNSWIDTGRDSWAFYYDDCIELEGSAICIGSGGYGYGGVIQNFIFYPRKPELYFGNVSDLFWSYSGYDMIDSEEVTGFETKISSYLNSCDADRYGYCNVPIKYVSKSAGTLKLKNLTIYYNYTNNASRDINATEINNYLSSQSSGFHNVPIKISSESNTTIQVDNINITYFGSDNISVTAHFDGDGTYSASNDTQLIMIQYSGLEVEIPVNYGYCEFLPKSSDSQDVRCYGQIDSKCCLNISHYNYDKPANLSIRINQSLNCSTIKVSSNSSLSNAVEFNTSWYQITLNKTLDDLSQLWMWMDFNCSHNNWFSEIPYLEVKGICSDCVKTS